MARHFYVEIEGVRILLTPDWELLENPVEVIPGYHTRRPNLGDAMKVAFPGLEFDFAVPQSWLDSDEKINDRFYKEGAVWAYPDKGLLGGQPLWGSEILKAYLDKIRAHPDVHNLDCAKAYVRDSGRTCPFCGHDQIEGESVETGGGSATQGMYCLKCGAYWIDAYRLVGFVKDNTAYFAK